MHLIKYFIKKRQRNCVQHDRKCDGDNVIPCYCNDFFKLNLAGLTDRLNYQLLICQSPIKITTLGGLQLSGRTFQIGSDYIDIHSEQGIVTILQDKIKHISHL
ncbi:hypothetical protein MTP04_16460 [Lysinibacillus sp. PLM2]|nr:hypothetical protein MTP04_16460 [Lysinibacillus sp. PLM2]